MQGSRSMRPERPLSSQLSPLRQHPIPLSLPASPSATQTIFLDHPSARISSSPASSPRIIDPSPLRRGSVHPAMSSTMERGFQPGADFFDDGSSDSGWEDSEGEFTHTFSEAEGFGTGSFMHEMHDKPHASSRGRSKERNMLTALPLFHQLPAQRSAFSMTMDDDIWSTPSNVKRPEKAREVSVRRLSKDSIRIVHTRSGTPRGSFRSNTSSTNVAFGLLPKFFQSSSDRSVEIARGERSQGRSRSNTTDSTIARSIIDAHVETMRALELLDDSPNGVLTNSESQTFGPSSTMTDFPKLSSFTNDRHITLSPLSTKRAGHNRNSQDRDPPPNLPSYFIRTPYPFSAKKEFPKPKSRPRQRQGTDSADRLDSGYDDDDESQHEYSDKKGKHVLGLLPSEGQYDLRSRLERNEEAQGIIRTRSTSLRESEESIIWLSLQRKSYRPGAEKHHVQKLVKITVPNSLMVSKPTDNRKEKSNMVNLDFDDKYFAEQLRTSYRTLSGTWFQRTLSARKLSAIRLGQTNTWSGTSRISTQPASGLLATGTGINTDPDTKSPFTENGLMALYHHPASGNASYTWVHWAQRVASSNAARPQHRRQARSLENNLAIFSQHDTELPDMITTLEFVHSLSTRRILTVLMLILAFSVAASVVWVVLGPAGTGIRVDEYRQRSDRVGSGMAIGILMLLVESVGVGAWMWCS
jgi:hypothetical protein